MTDPEYRFYWEPKPDITLYELALCLGPLIANRSLEAWELPKCATRHFRAEALKAAK